MNKYGFNKLVKRLLIITAIILIGIVVKQNLNGKSVDLTDVQNMDETVEKSDNEIIEYTENVELFINNQALSINFDELDGTWFDANQLTTEFTNKIENKSGVNFDVFVNGEIIDQNGSSFVELESLNKDENISISVINNDTQEEKTYYIRTLNSGINLTTSGQSEEEGYYYFTNNNYLIKMDTQCNIVFYKYVVNPFDFKRIEIDGVTYYGYLEEHDFYYNEFLKGCGSFRVSLYIMNENYEVIDSVETLINDDDVPYNHSLDDHEFVMVDLGHYIVEGYVSTEVDNIPSDIDDDGNATVCAMVIQEIVDGEYIMTWNSTHYPELYGLSVFKNDYDNEELEHSDYAHLNSIAVDPKDNNLILSFRHLDALIKIDRESGEILWMLGGLGDQFNLSDEQKFSKQHCIIFTEEGKMMFYDNGVKNEQSRALEFVLDEEKMEVIEFNEYSMDGYFGMYMGSAQRLSIDNDLILMGWGSRQESGVLFSEINFTTNEVVFEVSTTDENSSYRAYKFDY